MEQSYLNCPCSEAALSAEEFVASLDQSGRSGSRDRSRSSGRDRKQGCVCGQDCDHGCGECDAQLVCCCRAIPSRPEPVQVQEGCCCKQSFRTALGLLCSEELSSLLDFDQAAFITDRYVAGGTLSATVPAGGPADNLAAITGSFRRFTPCNCDLLDISAELVTPPDAVTLLTVTQVNVCQLSAVIIQLAETTAEGDLTADEVAARNFRRVKCLLSQRLNPCTICGQDNCCPCDCEGCCCAAGLLSTLAQGNLSRRVTLAAGPLLLRDVVLLGTAGSVLVLASDANRRIYFVCVNDIQFLA